MKGKNQKHFHLRLNGQLSCRIIIINNYCTLPVTYASSVNGIEWSHFILQLNKFIHGNMHNTHKKHTQWCFASGFTS